MAATGSREPTRVLIRRAQSGDRPALDELIDRYLPEIRAYVRLNAVAAVRLKESCSDLVQTVCRGVLRDLDKFEWRGEQSFKAWLYVAVLNKVRMRERRWRAERRDAKREEPADGARLPPVEAYGTLCTPSRHAAAREELARVEDAFERLPPDYREVLTLSRLCGLSHREIGERIGRTPGATKSLLNRAVARLTTLLAALLVVGALVPSSGQVRAQRPAATGRSELRPTMFVGACAIRAIPVCSPRRAGAWCWPRSPAKRAGIGAESRSRSSVAPTGIRSTRSHAAAGTRRATRRI